MIIKRAIPPTRVNDSLIPVYRLEKWMPFDLFTTIDTQSFRRVSAEQTCHNALCIRMHVIWEIERVAKDALVHGVNVLVIKRWQTSLGTIQVGSANFATDKQME